ncbi:SHOCT domain-containing protein [Lysinibacter sp. HNR]|uniref:SHOCT domain-containing protein n=1 Tax=Lysinibacter sp. HNR TaxID=3031408 RepID=UPI0024359952|nr:SHOCT domain-containing protein [Lysinibacter sp. HNR]WGD37954.1 SHOCT domain-containing protein [Lysinibacter sp. HNR]
MWSNIWDFVWVFFLAFVLIAYLFVLFSIVSDIFSDHKLNGWWKAVWCIFLIFVPFLTALVYLVARGRGMAMRQQSRLEQAQREGDDYIRTVAGSSPSDEISKARALLDAGTISQQEYEQLKARALAH